MGSQTEATPLTQARLQKKCRERASRKLGFKLILRYYRSAELSQISKFLVLFVDGASFQ